MICNSPASGTILKQWENRQVAADDVSSAGSELAVLAAVFPLDTAAADQVATELFVATGKKIFLAGLAARVL